MSGDSRRNTAETTVRLVIENGLQDAVTAFQSYPEATYTRDRTRRNAFQNLAEGSGLWHAACGKDIGATSMVPSLRS